MLIINKEKLKMTKIKIQITFSELLNKTSNYFIINEESIFD
jgi:hypothetical protein